MKDSVKFRKKQEGYNLVPELYEGYDYEYHIIQNFRNTLGLLDANPTFQGRVVDVIKDINNGRDDTYKYVVIAKVNYLDESIGEQEKNSDYSNSSEILYMDHFVPAPYDIKEPEIGELVYLEYTDPHNKLGGMYKGPVRPASILDLVKDTAGKLYQVAKTAASAFNDSPPQTLAAVSQKTITTNPAGRTDISPAITDDELRELLDTKLSPNFTLEEVIKTSKVTDLRQNLPDKTQFDNLKLLAINILEPIYSHYGKKPIINSGLRTTYVNEAVGGSKNSQHTKGQAVDIEMTGYSNGDFSLWISQNLKFDQIILEYYNKNIPDSGWVHVSYKKSANRSQLLTINSQTNGKPVSGLLT